MVTWTWPYNLRLTRSYQSKDFRRLEILLSNRGGAKLIIFVRGLAVCDEQLPPYWISRGMTKLTVLMTDISVLSGRWCLNTS